MKKFLKVLFYVIAAIYPVLMFTMFVVFKMPVRVLSLCVVVLACAFFLSATGNRKSDADSEKKALDWRPMLSSALFYWQEFSVLFLKKPFAKNTGR